MVFHAAPMQFLGMSPAGRDYLMRRVIAVQRQNESLRTPDG